MDGKAHVPGGGPQVSFDRPRSPDDEKPDKPEDNRPGDQAVSPQVPVRRPLHETRSEAEHARDVMSRPPVWRDSPGPAGSSLPRQGRDGGKSPAGADVPAEKASAPEEALKKQVADLWTQKQELGEKNYKLEMENKLLRTAKEVQQDKNADLEREKEVLGRENDGLRQENAELRSAKEVQDGKNAELEQKLVEQDKEIEALKAEVSSLGAESKERDRKDRVRDDQIRELRDSIGELVKERADEGGEQGRENNALDERSSGKREDDSERGKRERGWHLPSDTANTVVATAVGVGVALDHIPRNAADYGGIGVATAAFTAAGVAWIRERMKARREKNDAGNRPEG